MRALLDVNVLLALLQPEHVYHDRVHRWWDANRPHGWATCPLTQNGFLRIASQPSYALPIPVGEAMETLAEAISAPGHEFWPDDVSLTDLALFDHARMLGPKQLTDIYLLGLAVKRGGRLATLDRGIPLAAVRGAEPRHLATI